VEWKGAARIVDRARAPRVKVALIFGAGLGGQGEPSTVLAERLDTGIWLYRHHRVEKLLLSGNSEPYHDEVGVMSRYAQDHGVPASALLLDPKGVSTFESCRRAHALFHLKEAVLVTQRFHLPRALFLAHAVGIDAKGVAADQLRESAPFVLRELFSRPWALIQAWTFT
jgi:SanA protein